MLAKILQQKIVSVDLQENFLRQLRDNAAQKGVEHLIETQRGDMLSLSDNASTVDLIWSEGAIYCAGFDAALTAWYPLLADKGLVACTELSWLTDNPSLEPTTFWQKNYSAMRSVAQNVFAAQQLGYACLGRFTLPESCWWKEYYSPWLLHIEQLKEDAENDDYLRSAITNALTEIDLFRQFHQEYGYEFYLLQKSEVKTQRVSNRIFVQLETKVVSQRMALPNRLLRGK
jgi:serine/threonine-protein kinase HipA